MEIFIYKTSISSVELADQFLSLLLQHSDTLKATIDFEDVDKILRIEANNKEHIHYIQEISELKDIKLEELNDKIVEE